MVFFHGVPVLRKQRKIVEFIRIVIDVIKLGDFVFDQGLNEFVAILDNPCIPGHVVSRIGRGFSDFVGLRSIGSVGVGQERRAIPGSVRIFKKG